MKIVMLVLSLFLISCGKSKEAVLPDVTSAALEEQIARVSPSLLWCDGQATSPRKNNIDGRPACDLGDAMSESGHLALVGQFPQEPGILAAMSASILQTTGQPFRTASYVGKDNQNEFSRDQLSGLIEATLAGLPKDQLGKVIGYVRATGKLCPHPTDSRCDMTESMWILAKDALGESVASTDRWKDEATVNGEAETVPLGYQANLVTRKVFLKAVGHHLTKGYAHAMMLLHKRAPQNLWMRTVYKVTNGGTPGDFDAIGKDLVACMKTWQKPGTNWSWNQGSVACPSEVMGHELVALAQFLLRVEAAKFVADDGSVSYLLSF